MVANLDPVAVLETLVQRVRDLDGVRATAVFEYAEECSRLKITWSSGLSEAYTRSRAASIPVGARAVGRAFRSGELVVVDDIDADPAFAPGVRCRMHREGLDSLLAAPLAVQHRLLGVLAVYFDQSSCPGECDIDIIRALANLAAAALDNARLFQEQLRANGELQELSRRLFEQSEFFRQAAEVHTSLARTVLARDGLNGVIAALARLAHSTVLVEDVRLNMIGIADPGRPGAEGSVRSDELGLAHFQGDHRVRDHLVRLRKQPRPRVLHALPDIGIAFARITAPVLVGDELLAFISILRAESEFGPFDFVLSEQGSIAIALELMKGKAALDAEQRLRGNLLRCLLDGNLGDGSALMAATRFNLAGLQRVMVIRPDDTSEDQTRDDNACDSASVISQICDLVEVLVANPCPESTVVVSEDGLIVLLAGEQRLSEASTSDLARKIVSTVSDSLEPTTVSAGIGGVCKDPRDAARSFKEANAALEIGRILHKRGSVTAFSNLGILEVLLRNGKSEDLREFADRYLAPLATYDLRHNGGGLLETLETYVRRNYCLNETANDLYLHPNTVKYRLQKIEELCGIDLRNSEDSMNLQVALRLHRLIA